MDKLRDDLADVREAVFRDGAGFFRLFPFGARWLVGKSVQLPDLAFDGFDQSAAADEVDGFGG